MQELVTLERWKLALALIGVLVAGLLVGFLVERARTSGNAPVANTTPTAAPTATPSLLPTPSASASASATPSPSPSPTPAPATLAPDPSVGNGSKVASQQGSGNQTNTINAILQPNWGFSYSFLCSGGGHLNVTILDMSGSTVDGDPPFAVQGSQASGVQQFAKGGQQLQVQVRVDGSCQWSYDVYSS